MQNAPERMNESGTCTSTRAKSVQARSVDVPLHDCIKWLERYKPTPAERPHVSNLTQQLKRLPGNPALRPMILKSIERLSAAKSNI